MEECLTQTGSLMTHSFREKSHKIVISIAEDPFRKTIPCEKGEDTASYNTEPPLSGINVRSPTLVIYHCGASRTGSSGLVRSSHSSGLIQAFPGADRASPSTNGTVLCRFESLFFETPRPYVEPVTDI